MACGVPDERVVGMTGLVVIHTDGACSVNPGPGGVLRVWASILMEPDREGTQTGIALDGSGSMSKLYGVGALYSDMKLVQDIR